MAAYKCPMTPKVLKNGGSVNMQEQMAHANQPHAVFQKNNSPFARSTKFDGGVAAGKNADPEDAVDMAFDKRRGIKENSARDEALDAKKTRK